MNQWIADNIYNILTTIFGGGSLVAYFLERKQRQILLKKEESSAKQEEATALETIQSVYDKFVKDSQNRYMELLNQINEIKKELENVYSELEVVTKELNEEKQKGSLLKISYETLKKTCEEFSKNK